MRSKSSSNKRNSSSRGGSFKARLCTSKNDQMNADDDLSDQNNNSNMLDDAYFDTEKNYLLCGIICTKSMVIIFNFLFIISGILLILFGVWTLVYKQDYVALSTTSLYQIATYVLIFAGILIIITGIIGIVSAWFESKRFLIVFIVLLVSVFAIEMTAGVLAFSYKVNLNDSLKLDLETIIHEQYNQTGYESKSALLDELQTKMKCCGASDFSDWRESRYVRSQNESVRSVSESRKANLVAESCCKTPSHLCGRRTHPSNIYYHGCVPALEKHITNHIILIGVVSVSACLFQSIGFFLTALLIKRINQRKQYSFLKPNDN